MRTFLSRAFDLVFHRSRERRIDEEVRTHLALLVDEYERKGLSRHEAELAARRAFGGVDRIREAYRDQRGFRPLADLSQDLALALRVIARERWYAGSTVIALSLGIGVASTMLTILYCMNVRGLPFEQAAALVRIAGEPARGVGTQVPFALFDLWRTTATTITAIGAEVDASVNLGDDIRTTDRFAGAHVSSGVFAVLRERPALGRAFEPDDDRVGAPAVAMIGHRLWRERYGSDPTIIGRAIRINGQPGAIVGVMREGFRYPVDQEVWLPLSALPEPPVGSPRPVRLVARLADTVSPDQALAELTAIAASAGEVAEADRVRRFLVLPLNDAYVGSVLQPVPMMLLAAVLVVLLIACGHAASLLLARGTARLQEMSIRTALGASRGRIIRQLLVESVMTACLAGFVGIGLTAIAVRAFANEVAGFGLPYWTRFDFDATIVGVIAVLCVATGIAFGLLPALRVSRINLTELMNQGGRSGRLGSRQRTTAVLLVAELALTVVLLSAAAALFRSANGVYRADQAIDVASLWELRVTLPQDTYGSAERRRAFFAALDERLATASGWSSAAVASSAPFNARDSRAVRLDGESPSESGAGRTVRLVAVGNRYFDTLGLQLVRGTRFEDLPAARRATAAIVNQRFVDRFLPDVEPIGREVLLVNEQAGDLAPERVTIVGIAPPLRQQIAAGHTPVVYVPHEREPGATASILVRGNPDAFAPMVRQQVRDLDPDLPVFNLNSLERISYMSRWIPRIMSTGFSVVAVIATVLSAMGLFALTAFAVSQRTREVGVRMALGATRAQVSWLFLKRAAAHVSVGLALGLIGALAIGSLLQATLVDVRANEPWVLAVVCGLLASITAVASLFPARRAARLDPVDTLRRD